MANSLRVHPVTFFTDLGNVALSRVSTEATYMLRLKNSFVNYYKVMNDYLNSTGPVNDIRKLISITDYAIEMKLSLTNIVSDSNMLIGSLSALTNDVSNVRSNTSLVLSPTNVNGLLNSTNVESTVSYLRNILHNFSYIKLNVQHIGRIALAHGSYSDTFTKVYKSEETGSNNARTNFINSYNRMINGLTSAINSHKETATNGFSAFVTRIQQNYDDTIVRARFESSQREPISQFVRGLVSNVYNTEFIKKSFDDFKDQVIDNYSESTEGFFNESSSLREITLHAIQTINKRYPTCLDDLMSLSQTRITTISSQYLLCLNERTSGIMIVLPSTSTWLNTIRDNINFILQQLNSCVTSRNDLAGRTAISNCIQSVS